MIWKRNLGDRIFDAANYVFLSLLIIITLYPFYFIFVASISDPLQLMKSTGLMLWPKGFNISGYALVFKNPNIVTGYTNTLIYVFFGTSLNVFLTLLAAYVLSRKWMYGRNIFMGFITFTMFFQGGLIPSYLVVKNLGLIDNRLVMILPTAVVVWNIIIMRTFFNTIDDSMEESAKMDGAGDFTVLFKVMLPIALPAVAVTVLFYAVGHWNAWFNALIYFKKREFYPLQLFLREILLQGQSQDMAEAKDMLYENIKYATVIVSTVPILLLYPFLQKYFVKGMMVGAIKG